MNSIPKKNLGLKRLVARCRNDFRRPENTEYYLEKDYREAEKKYVRFCMTGDPRYTKTAGFSGKPDRE